MLEGDTLRSIAQRVYGNGSLWYVLAAANAVTDADLVAGTTLEAPEVKTTTNDAGTFKPFDPHAVEGPTTPALPYILPPPSQKQCDALSTVLMVAVAVIVTVYTAGAAASYFGATATAGGATGAGAIGGAAISGGGLAVAEGAALTAGQIAVSSAAMGGFAGSVASQLVGKATGAVDHFSLRGAVASGLTAGLTAGIGGALGPMSELIEGGRWGEVAASATLASMGGYAANRIAGIDASFSWRSVAADAVSAVAAGRINKKLGTVFEPGVSNGIVRDTVSGMVGGIVSLHTHRVFGDERDVDYGRMAADAFGNALGNAAIASINSVQMDRKLRVAMESSTEATRRVVGEWQKEGVPTEQILLYVNGAKEAGIDLGVLGAAGAGKTAAHAAAPSTPEEAAVYDTLKYLGRTDEAGEIYSLIEFKNKLDSWAQKTGLLERIEAASQDRNSEMARSLYASDAYRFYEGAAYSLLAKDSYFNIGIQELLPQGVTRYSWERAVTEFHLGNTAEPLENSETGYFAALYYDALNDRTVYANRGTDDMPDVGADALQAIGRFEPQYEQAIRNAYQVTKVDPNVVFVGHSLGGGLASLQALATQKQAWTYNSASLAKGTLERYRLSAKNAKQLIQAYYVGGDILSAIQDIPTAILVPEMLQPLNALPSAIGRRIPLAPPYLPIVTNPILWPVQMHYMGSVINSFSQMLP